MKFLPENKKKKMWSIGLLTVSVLGIIYLNFFSGARPAGPVGTAPDDFVPGGPDDPDIVSDAPAEQPAAPVASGRPPAASKLLPFGRTIDTSVLESQRFASLQAPPVLSVSPEELGKADLFSSSTEKPLDQTLSEPSPTTTPITTEE